MRNNKLDRLDDSWNKRPLFKRKRRFRVVRWLFTLMLLGGVLLLAGNQIPDLLLEGFKTIAHMAPANPQSDQTQQQLLLR